MSKRIYQQGRRVTSIDDIESAQSGFFWRNKWYAVGWIKSWQYQFLMNQIRDNNLYLAELTEYGRELRIREVQFLVDIGVDINTFIH